jgi:hypothetical protein
VSFAVGSRLVVVWKHDPMPSPHLAATDDPGTAYLVERINLVADRLAAVAGAGDDADALDVELGRIADAVAELDRKAEKAEQAKRSAASIPTRSVAAAFGLAPAEVDVILLSALVDLDPDARGRCAAFHGSTDAVRPTIGLALACLGASVDHRSAMGYFGEASPLVRHHLVAIEAFDRPLTARAYSVPDRVVRALWGSTQVDPLLRNLQAPLVGVASDEATAVADAIRAGIRSIYVRERPLASGLAFASAVVDALDVSALAFDLRRAGTDQPAYGLAAAAAREGGLNDAVVVIGPIDRLTSRDLESLVPLLDAPWPVVMFGPDAWEPAWSRGVPLVVDAVRADPAAVAQLWASTLAARDQELADDAAEVISVLRLTPDQTVRAAVASALAAAGQDGPVTGAHVRVGARGQSAGRLESLAERIEPHTTFADLVLPDRHLDQVRQVAERGRLRDRVLDEWQMGGPGSRGRGITALFAGDSGTGKTLSAEAIAGELGVDLYVIDLSTVVDKYIGETEKNLGRVFDEAEGINGVLFFDEADALFGKRSETSDAKDRYANVEVAYLLQRMERFEGVAILATNLRSNIDDAFTRRLDIIVHFVLPDVDHRRLLWERHLPETLPQADDVDVEFLASRFEIAGGVIRNVALTAAYRAAQRGAEVTMGDLVRAMSAEYSKMGRLFDTSVLGRHARSLDDDLLP